MKINRLTRFAMTLLALIIALPILAQNAALTIIGGDEQHLREALGFLVWSEPGVETNITLGAVSDDLEFVPPVSTNAHIVGTITREPNYGTEIWILSNGAPQDDLDFYTQALLADNWTSPEDMRGSTGGGFVTQVNVGAGFCAPDNDAFLWVNIQERATGNHITLHLGTQHIPPSCGADSQNYMSLDPYRLMPRIVTPDGVTIRDGVNGGGGGGGGPYGPQSASTSIVLTTDFAATELRELYDAQLVAQDWQLVESGGDVTSAWSAWSFTDDDSNEWIATLTMTALPNKDGEFYAVLYIENIPQ